ncbi:MAG TPA: TonB-dependent receptor [Allosphingosinicella sp.]|jgi:outer membrane receptor protein involved in Fe transport|nr:TonB-dependent receptor [Allosphingosinicella sp.]
MLLALAQVLAAAAPAPPPEMGEPIVVTASRTAEGPVAGVSAIDADEISRLQPASLLEALDDVAGVRAFSTGGVGGGSFLSIRGGEPNFTMVLVDGIRLNNPTNSRGGAFDFFAIDPALVERIEVARGAVSAVHGADALSGVVNIRLRAPVPGETGATARASLGSEGDIGLGLALNHGWRDGGLLVSAGWYDSGGLDLGSDLERRQALARIDHSIGGFEGRALGLYAHADRFTFPEDSGGPLFAVNRARETGDYELRAGALSLRRSRDAGVRPGFTFSWSEQRDDRVTPAIAPGMLGAVPALAADALFSRVEAIGEIGAGNGPLTATLGAAYLRESGRSDGIIDFGFPLPVAFDLVRTTRSAFAEAAWRPSPAVAVNLAGRYDDVARGPHAWTGRAAISVQPSAAGPAFFARIGEGYKLPSFYALGHPLIGNPALRPERSRNMEAGIEWTRAGGDLLRLTLFDNRFRDLIDFDPLLFAIVNRDRVRARGAELEGRWRARPGLILAGALTWLDLESATPLRGRPRWQGSLRLIWRAGDALELNAAVRANSAFNDSSIPTGLVRARGHAEADLGLRYRLTPALTLDAALKNLTDSRHQDAIGFPAPGRLLRASLSAAF